MGTADIIPGVSGGTIAFISGIYAQLLAAIAAFDGSFLNHFFRLRWKEALAHSHLRFLIPLLLGIAVAILSTARITHFLLKNYPAPTWSLFFGLIAASILVVGASIKDWSVNNAGILLLGAVAAYTIVGIIPVSTPETALFIFLSGMIAICAMILPGLSGAFILLILGKYQFITGALRNPFDSENLFIICIFIAGCLVGILGFSRILQHGLKHYHDATLCALTGLMIGAMRKVWPWKEVLETQIIRGKEHVLREENIMPLMDGGVILALGMMVLGFVLIMTLERLAQQKVPHS